MAFSDLSLEVAAEFSGFAGAREFFDADGYGFRKFGKFDNDDVRRIRAVLSAARWAKANPERRREIARKWWHSEKGRAAAARRNAKRREVCAKSALKAAPLVCTECRQQFKRRRAGPAPSFCGNACWQRARYQARTLGAKRIRRRGTPIDAVERKARRLAKQREWARKNAAERRAA